MLLNGWWNGREEIRVLDLGSGTGSNLRYLAPRLSPIQRWTLLDRDATLLQRACGAGPWSAGAVHVEQVRGDLASEGIQAVDQVELVTGSALLDLVSEGWLDLLVEACRGASCAALFALTWDGTALWRTEDDTREDELVLDLVRAHQRRDKGLGPALGPTAGPAAARAFDGAGYRTWLLPSLWRLGSEDAQLALALIDGWEEAALEQRPDQVAHIRRWAEYRRLGTANPGFELSVGHLDLLALPRSASRPEAARAAASRHSVDARGAGHDNPSTGS